MLFDCISLSCFRKKFSLFSKVYNASSSADDGSKISLNRFGLEGDLDSCTSFCTSFLQITLAEEAQNWLTISRERSPKGHALRWNLLKGRRNVYKDYARDLQEQFLEREECSVDGYRVQGPSGGGGDAGGGQEKEDLNDAWTRVVGEIKRGARIPVPEGKYRDEDREPGSEAGVPTPAGRSGDLQKPAGPSKSEDECKENFWNKVSCLLLIRLLDHPSW